MLDIIHFRIFYLPVYCLGT